MTILRAKKHVDKEVDYVSQFVCPSVTISFDELPDTRDGLIAD